MRLALISGWSFQRDFWQSLVARLPSDWTFAYIEPGPSGSFTGVSDATAVLCHSLGLLAYLHALQQPSSAIFVLNGFTRYAADADFPDGVALRVLRRMRTRLLQDSLEVVDDFRGRSVMPGDVRALASQPLNHLLWGLDCLCSCDARNIWSNLRVYKRVLASRDDAIAPAAMVRSCFAESEIEWVSQGGHCLPLAEPELCAEIVKRWVREMP